MAAGDKVDNKDDLQHQEVEVLDHRVMTDMDYLEGGVFVHQAAEVLVHQAEGVSVRQAGEDFHQMIQTQKTMRIFNNHLNAPLYLCQEAGGHQGDHLDHQEDRQDHQGDRQGHQTDVGYPEGHHGGCTHQRGGHKGHNANPKHHRTQGM